MANNGTSRKMQNLTSVLILICMAISGWTITKLIVLDKELYTLKKANEIEHAGFDKADNTMIQEVRSTNRKLDKVYTTTIKIATKLDVDIR